MAERGDDTRAGVPDEGRVAGARAGDRASPDAAGGAGSGLERAARAAVTAQPLWSLVPVASRAAYVRRAAVALLDELDDLAVQLTDETGWPKAHVVLSELLPAVSGLHALATDGPRALADRRLQSRIALLAGRSTRLVQSPVGVIGLAGPSASPFAEPALETAAALLAGNGVILAAGAAPQRLKRVFLRAGLPGELLSLAAPQPLDHVAGRVHRLRPPGRRGTLLVLEGAPREPLVEAAVYAAFAAAGRHPAAAGRLVTVEGAVPGLVEALTTRAAGLRRGDPRAEGTDLPDDAGTPQIVPTTPDDPRFTDPQGLTLAVVTVPDADTAVRVAARDGRAGAISVWARDRDKGERVSRRLPSEMTWFGRHDVAQTAVDVRLARHVVPRQLEWRAPWAPGTPRLPLDGVTQRTALAELRHGRESRRWPALRAVVRSRRNR